MSRAEGVVHVQIAQCRQLLAEGRVVLLLALIEAQVLQQQHVPVGQGRHLGPGVLAHGVGGEGHVAAQKLGQARGGRAQRELLLEALSGRAAQMAHEHHVGTPVHELLDGGQRRADASVVGYRIAVERHVEVHAHEHALTGHLGVVDSLDIGHALSFYFCVFSHLMHSAIYS